MEFIFNLLRKICSPTHRLNINAVNVSGGWVWSHRLDLGGSRGFWADGVVQSHRVTHLSITIKKSSILWVDKRRFLIHLPELVFRLVAVLPRALNNVWCLSLRLVERISRMLIAWSPENRRKIWSLWRAGWRGRRCWGWSSWRWFLWRPCFGARPRRWVYLLSRLKSWIIVEQRSRCKKRNQNNTEPNCGVIAGSSSSIGLVGIRLAMGWSPTYHY